ncbi:MAG: hypothetical protein IPJ65_36740 [Archangiaceae bacterium]|nr:hypothetical protein [Archangiaceae bacterium]
MGHLEQALACVDAGCGDPQIDPSNCGTCGHVCTLSQATPACRGGACVVGACAPGYADVDGNPANGCEASCAPDGGRELCDGIDNDCNGFVDEGFDLQRDAHHCGSCTNDCGSAANTVGTCNSGSCGVRLCAPGAWPMLDGGCGLCVPTGPETCDGLDNDCNGLVDDALTAVPTPTSACGVGPVATAPECTTQVGIACMNGAWKCTFPQNVCSNGNCAAQAELCDTLDNNCDGRVNELWPDYGRPCASDDGLPAPGHGACRTIGTYTCMGNVTACSALKADCLTTPGGCVEQCDGVDNDCDGLIDESFNNKGANSTYFVKPAVTHVQINPGVWMFTYEASRVRADSVSAGYGDGYSTSAPAGRTYDRTVACSLANHQPWTGVTGLEAEQTCAAQGGHICTPTEWQTGCAAKLAPTTSCTWGYGPAGAACTSGFIAGTKYCNLGMSYDADPVRPGIQGSVLPTASGNLKGCYADWSGVLGNVAGVTDHVFDMTGNVRELTKAATNQYVLMGGSYLTASEGGASCNNTFYNVDQAFSFSDTGFRCCFSADPTQ